MIKLHQIHSLNLGTNPPLMVEQATKRSCFTSKNWNAAYFCIAGYASQPRSVEFQLLSGAKKHGSHTPHPLQEQVLSQVQP